MNSQSFDCITYLRLSVSLLNRIKNMTITELSRPCLVNVANNIKTSFTEKS